MEQLSLGELRHLEQNLSDSSVWGMLRLAVLETNDGKQMESSRERVIDMISRGFWLDVERRWGRQWFGRSRQGPEDVDET